MINRFRKFIETPLFGVCAWLGEKMGIKTTTVRLYFVYISFFTFGSPIIVYFVMAFLLENKNYFKPKKYKRPSVWDL
jgi:phage shock protein PspC (stress-responsive transcriptional regulator)